MKNIEVSTATTEPASLTLPILSSDLIGLCRGLIAKALAQATIDKNRRGMPDYLRNAVEAEVASLTKALAEFEAVYPPAG